MKLSSFFVAAMVITSANAGLLDDIRQGAGNIRDQASIVFSSSSPSKHEGLKYFDNTNIEEYITPQKVSDDLTEKDLGEVIMLEGVDYKAIMELIGYMYGCFSIFVEIESKYLKEYPPLPKDFPILTSTKLEQHIHILQKDLFQIDEHRSRSYQIQNSYNH
ncbi:hypothetical protein BASA62_008014 [Batrachochytrium salamandrivorans]|nr:hypothetical protein BASA62_008014 [Batrachochytrium salamandrivorans]